MKLKPILTVKYKGVICLKIRQLLTIFSVLLLLFFGSHSLADTGFRSQDIQKIQFKINQGEINNKRFRVVKSLDEGAYGNVFVIQFLDNPNKLFALKVYKKKKGVSLLGPLQKELVKSLIEISPSVAQSVKIFEYGKVSDFDAIVMEYKDSLDLDRYIHNLKPNTVSLYNDLTSEELESRIELIESLFKQILYALYEYHKNGLVLRDLHVGNILFDTSTKKITLIDLLDKMAKVGDGQFEVAHVSELSNDMRAKPSAIIDYLLLAKTLVEIISGNSPVDNLNNYGGHLAVEQFKERNESFNAKISSQVDAYYQELSYRSVTLMLDVYKLVKGKVSKKHLNIIKAFILFVRAVNQMDNSDKNFELYVKSTRIAELFNDPALKLFFQEKLFDKINSAMTSKCSSSLE